MNHSNYKILTNFSVYFIVFISKKRKNDEPENHISKHRSTCTGLFTITKKELVKKNHMCTYTHTQKGSFLYNLNKTMQK